MRHVVPQATRSGQADDVLLGVLHAPVRRGRACREHEHRRKNKCEDSKKAPMTDVAVHGYSFGEGVSVRTPDAPGSLAGESRIDATAGDAALVTRARAGDEAAFQSLYERHQASVARVCRRWL